MAYIDFDFELANSCESKIRSIAQEIEQESNKFQNIIVNVQTNWIGTGSNEYIERLDILKKEISARAQRLNDIANAIRSSITRAEEADREAARQLEAMNNLTVCNPEPPPMCPDPKTLNTDLPPASNKSSAGSGVGSGQARPSHSSRSTSSGTQGNLMDRVMETAVDALRKSGKKR